MRLTDLDEVRARLNRDRDWAAYAIGDLAPGYIDNCEWYVPANDPTALLLVYRGFAPPITFAMGDAEALREVFGEIDAPAISLHVRPEVLAIIAPIYTPTETRGMRRMSLRPDAFTPARYDDVEPIGEEHVDAVVALYEDGGPHGERPTFFAPSMLRHKTFRGVWEGDTLVAIAGTHLYSAELAVCAVGNVYTRRDRRGRGLAAQVTSAVVADAIRERVSTIVLNVGVHNHGAQRVYERLGFTRYCDFLEGDAVRNGAS